MMLGLPLWIVTEHIQTSEPEHGPCNEPGKAMAFSTSGKLFAFLSANLEGEWKMTMAADRDGLVILIADLHRLNVETICLDPENDGSAAQEIPLANLMALVESLR